MTEKTHDQLQLERLTFFSDAVFAIAMTLLVVEVKLPDNVPATDVGLADALLRLIPQYIGFLVSFLVVGRFWIGHHRVFGRLKRVDDGLVGRNLWALLTIAFMPFPTTLVSHYVGTRVGVCFYAAWLTLAGLANVMVERYAMRGPLVAPGGIDDLRRWAQGGWAPVTIGVLAFAAALVDPLFALVPLGLSPVIVRLFTRKARAKALPRK